MKKRWGGKFVPFPVDEQIQTNGYTNGEREKRLARLLEILPTSVSRLQAKDAKLTALELKTHIHTHTQSHSTLTMKSTHIAP